MKDNPYKDELETIAAQIYHQKQTLASLFCMNSYNTNPEELMDLDANIMLEEDILGKLQEQYYPIMRSYIAFQTEELRSKK